MRVSPAAGPILGIVIAVALFVATRTLDRVVTGDQLGPAFWPRLVLGGLALACAAKLVSAVRRSRAVRRLTHDDTTLPPIARGKLTIAIAVIVLYVAGTEVLGFALATAAFIAAFMAVCGARGPVTVATHAVLGTVVLVYLFVKLVYLPLPKGAGPFEALTLAVYRALHVF